MGTPSANQYFEAIHTGPGDPTSPNLFTAAELVAGSFSSAAVSSATSTAVSTVNAAAPDSSSISQARSQAVSAATNASIADSKAISVSGNTSVADSKALSNSLNVSIADSKAVSVATATPVVTAVVYSGNISTADSKAVSDAKIIGTNVQNRTVTTLPDYLANNAVFNVLDYGASTSGTGAANTTAFARAMTALGANGGGIFYIPQGSFTVDPPTLVSNCTVRGAGKAVTTLTAYTTGARWTGTDLSNIEISDFTFNGLTNNGASATNQAIYIVASTVDIENISVRRCAFKQFKSTEVIRIAGNGDLVTPATFFAKVIRVEDCDIRQYYDLDSSTRTQNCAGIYFFGGVKECWAVNNYVDGTNGKDGIFAHSEATRVHIEGNTVVNCGSANANFGYGIAVYSSYTTASVVDATVARNHVFNSSKGGIYLAVASKYSVTNNILDTCDVNSSGLGGVGVGAIMINNPNDNPGNGVGVVADNTVIDPGYCGIYINTASFQRTSCTVTGNTCKVTTAVNRTGLVYWGRGCVVSGNQFRGFTTGIFLNNTADNLVGDLTISDNEINGTGASGSPTGINYLSAVFIINPLTITGNRFKGCVTGLQVINVTDLVVSNNAFFGATTGLAATGITRGSITGNLLDGATTGMTLGLITGLVTARMVVTGNVLSFCTSPFSLTENSGRINIDGNDVAGQMGIGGNNGDTSVSFNPVLKYYPWNTTLTASRTQTLQTGGCYRGQEVTIIRSATVPGAFTFLVVNGGPGAGTLYTITANNNGWVRAVFDGTNWILAGAGLS